MKKIYVIGSSNTDMVVKCDRLPRPGETVVGGVFYQVHGGKGANQAVAAARMGGNVHFFCRVGDDANGQASLQAYKKEGIDIRYIRIKEGGQSGVALIMVDEQGENSIAVASGVNADMKPADIDPLTALLMPGDVVLLQLEIPLETVAHAAAVGRKQGAMVVLDPAPVPRQSLPDALLAHVDFLLPNEHEAAALTGTDASTQAIADFMQAKRIKNVILTAGARGCVWISEHQTQAYPAFKVQALDSTAAGDAFAGSFAVALSEGMETQAAIQFAQKAAALSVIRMGAQPSLPTRAEMEAFTGA
ncbi:MAG: ribokinase [bacterium]|jgi:ribokinase|nr:ribokinase [bacterium]